METGSGVAHIFEKGSGEFISYISCVAERGVLNIFSDESSMLFTVVSSILV